MVDLTATHGLVTGARATQVLVIWRRILPRVVTVSTLTDVGGVVVVSMGALCLTCLECTNAQQSSLDIRPILLRSEAAAELRS